MDKLTNLLNAINAGGPADAGDLFAAVYDELRRLAAAHAAREGPGGAMDATALVHEAYLRLAGDRRFNDPRHFFRAAAEAMRRILIDRARERRRLKRGGDGREVSLTGVEPAADAPADDLLALDEALTRFAAVDPAKAELVRLRFYGGLTEAEAAEALGVSRATASRHWAYARAWLIDALGDRPTESGNSENR